MSLFKQWNWIVTILTLCSLFHSLLAQTPPGFEPGATSPLVIQYGNTTVGKPGQLLRQSLVGEPPILGTASALTGTYLAVLVDPTAGTATQRVTVLHYAISGLNSSSKFVKGGNGAIYYPLTTSDQALASYLDPEPTPGPAHSYVITLWKQPPNFQWPGTFDSYLPLNLKNLTNRYPFNLTDLAAAANLGEPVAGSYFDVMAATSTTATSTSATVTPSAATSSSAGATYRPFLSVFFFPLFCLFAG